MASQLLGNDAAQRILIRCWGDFAFEDAESGADLRPRGRKARALLAYLALQPGKPVSRERLAALLWGDRADEQARSSLRQTLFELRALPSIDALLIVDRETVTFRREAIETDIELMQELADAGDFGELLTLLPSTDDRLLASLDGIDSEFDQWLRIERARQREALILLIADASAVAASTGNASYARRLHARLAEFTEEAAPSQSPVVPVEALAAPSMAVQDARAPSITLFRRPLLAAGAAAMLLAGSALAVRWWMPAARPDTTALHYEAYGLYTSARTMVRKRNAEITPAINMLRRAVAIDPEFAPAWAELAIATGIGADNERILEAERYARRALAIDPNLADAHAALGMLAGFHGPEAAEHLKRAMELNPNDAQIQFWLSNHYATELNFGKRLDALRRAVAIDPYWPRAVNEAALAAWNMGNRDEAARFVRHLTEADPAAAVECDYRLDLESGAYASIVQKIARMRQQRGFPPQADAKLGFVLLLLGYPDQARLLLRLPRYQWEIAGGGPISPEAFRQVEAVSDSDSLTAGDLLPIAMQRLLFEGRAAEIVSRVDAGSGVLPLVKPDGSDLLTLVELGPDVVLALRSVGRHKDADILLGKVDMLVRKAFAQGPVSTPFLVTAARLRAVQGRNDEALVLLKTATDRGWYYAPPSPRPDIAGIYAFRGLQGDPRFEAIRRTQREHIERERQALGPVPV